MRVTKLGLLAVGALVVGVAGCSLPEVLPIANGTTQGPSPYGPWYEQHWATNAVLLAAADQPEGDVNSDTLDSAPKPEDDAAAKPEDDAAAKADAGTPVLKNAVVQSGQPAAVESTVSTSQRSVDFDSSTPYQFPASSYAPGHAVPSDDSAPAPVPSAPDKKTAPAQSGPIRY